MVEVFAELNCGIKGMMGKKLLIHCFRRDLRLVDNPALAYALKSGVVLPVFILDDGLGDASQMGAASRVYLHHSLEALNKDLGKKLLYFKGDAAVILSELSEQFSVSEIVWNTVFEPAYMKEDKRLSQCLEEKGVSIRSFNASLLWEPEQILKEDESAYKVFSSYYRQAISHADAPRSPVSLPRKREFVHAKGHGIPITELGLLPDLAWPGQIMNTKAVGETAAQRSLKRFLSQGIHEYKVGRDFPSEGINSRLSSHLHFGEISPHQIWDYCSELRDSEGVEMFLKELLWREFAAYLLYFNPKMPEQALKPRFHCFAWRDAPEDLRAWQQGMTGIPMVDAGMRELWLTGHMHNRVRMIVSSFLVKNLLIDWRKGAEWFWDCLCDADLASNAMNWQWVAGSGVDAVPFFRIFNPVTQGKRFDAEGDYVRRYVPEIARLPNRYLFSPWEAEPEVLEKAGVRLGIDYPQPIVDLKASRQRALDTYGAS